MKKTFIVFLVSLALSGCASLELGDALSSEQYTQQILDLGLTHEENLEEASKLKTPHLVSVVTLQLTNARDEKVQNELDLIESKKYKDKLLITNNGSKITGTQLTESIKTGVLSTDFDIQSYYLEGIKNSNSSNFSHKLNITITHNSKNIREYLSANICDKWGRCEDLSEDGSNNKLELKALSENASNCLADLCEYSENIEVILSDNFLNDSLEKGFSLNLISKKKSHKIKVPKPYLLGYLAVAQ